MRLFDRSSQGHPDCFETENLNPEDVFNSIKKTSADIQSLSISSKLEPYEDVKKKPDFTSQDSGIQELRMDSPDGLDHKRGFFSYSQVSWHSRTVCNLSEMMTRNKSSVFI